MLKKLSAVLLVVVLLLSGCSKAPSSSSSPPPSDDSAISKEVLSYIKEQVEEALIGFDVDSVSVSEDDGKVTVLAYLKNGISGVDFPAFCEIVSSSALEAIGEKEVELGNLTVGANAKSGSMINWRSKDGLKGTLLDSRGEEKNVYSGVALDEIEGKLGK